ncbi:hypothetical protein ACFOSC_27885 [Streptantibioticus rubrisoli]|uniref:Uncharacterized protein n=1 Tax=Streptantibioticus rubrisoli TaxID=1387313 RepID=A0ABT1PKD3_9ACTN|nr:hypothetical protein [Streptantibioticus rubrisoli]MCQ4045827.1 hypothetical protein [Streptantibioticus rubrisoli]
MNLAALSIVPVPVLLNSDVPSDTTYLDGMRDQNAVLMRLRTAAATPGPLLVYLSGRLTVDSRSHQLYLALVGTKASTARYTALPWQWLTTELRYRPAGTTTVLVDLAADKAAWPQLQTYGTLPAGPAEVYGIVAPPGWPGTDSVSAYTRSVIDVLRQYPQRLAHARVHALAVAAADLPPGTLVLPAAAQIATSRPHDEPAPRPVSNLQRLLAGDLDVLPNRRRLTQRALNPDQLPPSPVEQPEETWRQPPPPRQPAPPAPQPTTPQPTRGPHPETSPAPPQTPAPRQPASPAPQPQQPTYAPQPVIPHPQDPRPIIWQTAQAGRHNEAAEMAAAWEQYALQQFGADSPQATQWAEIRADLARMAGRWAYATQLWIAAARTRLAHQAPDVPEVLNAATSAHYCWTQVTDPTEARACGPELVNLLRQLPALDPRHLSTAQRRLQDLQHTPTRP